MSRRKTSSTQRQARRVYLLTGVRTPCHNKDMNTNTLIASANTRNGFAIGVVVNARSQSYLVVRMDRGSRYVTISNHVTEAAARSASNTEWAADKGVAA